MELTFQEAVSGKGVVCRMNRLQLGSHLGICWPRRAFVGCGHEDVGHSGLVLNRQVTWGHPKWARA